MKNLKRKLENVFDETNELLPSDLTSEQPEIEEIEEEELDDTEDETPINLPALNLPQLPPPILITPLTSEKDHQAADLDVTNQSLQRIHNLWSVRDMTIRDACLLIDKTHATIEHRRKAINRQYGYQSDGTKGGKIPDLD